MGTIRIKKEVDLAIRPLEKIKSVEKWVSLVIELREAYPYPWEHLTVVEYDRKTGDPCKWEWEDDGASNWEDIYTHHGFCGLFPMHDRVRKDLEAIAERRVPVVVGNYVLYPMHSSYNGGTVLSGLRMVRGIDIKTALQEIKEAGE